MPAVQLGAPFLVVVVLALVLGGANGQRGPLDTTVAANATGGWGAAAVVAGWRLWHCHCTTHLQRPGALQVWPQTGL